MSPRALREGDVAPAFTLPTTGGRTIRLADVRGRPVVLYFYPKDNTPGCTREACAFQASLSAFEAAGAVVLGVSRDSVEAHARFAGTCSLSFPLLSDGTGAVCRAYGIFKRKSMYGRTSLGIERTTFLIGPSGRILKVFAKVQVEGHAEAVLDALSQAVRQAARRGPTPRRLRTSIRSGLRGSGAGGAGRGIGLRMSDCGLRGVGTPDSEFRTPHSARRMRGGPQPKALSPHRR